MNTGPSIRIAIVDDHQIVIDGLKALLRDMAHLQIVVTATSGSEILSLLETHPADILLTDVMMPGMNGQQLARTVRRRFPQLRIIALSMSDNGSIVEEMINDADLCGYLLKQTGAEELVRAIEKVHAGGQYFQEAVLAELERHNDRKKAVSDTHLTAREREIIALMEKDFSNKQIADTLHIAVRTVETHRKNIFRKTGTNNVLSLVKWAYQHQLLPE